ncbi:MAG: transcription elongation factor GreA [bacterium]
MVGDGIYLTKDGFEKLREEMEHCKVVKRKEIARTLEHARSLGDLKENAEYDAAKEAQAKNERKIAELQEKLGNARIIEYENIPSDEVRIGATVKLKDLDSNEEITYTLVSELEADFSQGKISLNSPVGQGLSGAKEKQKVEIKIPAGILKYKILKISR